MKQKTHKPCAYCGTEFKLFKTTDKYCSRNCIIFGNKLNDFSKKVKSEKDKKSSRIKNLLDVAVNQFHTFIKNRDRDKPCFCCGKPLRDNFHAGHVFSGGGHAAVKFDEDNVHGQRADCNTGHRIGLLDNMFNGCEERIGSDAFEVLRSKAYEHKSWTEDELQRIISKYKKLNQES